MEKVHWKVNLGQEFYGISRKRRFLDPDLSSELR